MGRGGHHDFRKPLSAHRAKRHDRDRPRVPGPRVASRRDGHRLRRHRAQPDRLRPHGPHPTLRRRAGRERFRTRNRRHHVDQPPRLSRRLPRHRLRRRHSHHGEPDLHGARTELPTRRQRCFALRRPPRLPRHRAGGRQGHRRPSDRHSGRGRSRGRDADRRLPRRTARRTGRGRSRHPRRRPALFLGHHWPAQGRDAVPPQHRHQRRPVARLPVDPAQRMDGSLPAVLPHLRPDAFNERLPRKGRQHRHPAAVRPEALPRTRAGIQDTSHLGRAAGGHSARQAPDGRRVRPVVSEVGLLRRSPCRRDADERRA